MSVSKYRRARRAPRFARQNPSVFCCRASPPIAQTAHEEGSNPGGRQPRISASRRSRAIPCIKPQRADPPDRARPRSAIAPSPVRSVSESARFTANYRPGSNFRSYVVASARAGITDLLIGGTVSGHQTPAAMSAWRSHKWYPNRRASQPTWGLPSEVLIVVAIIGVVAAADSGAVVGVDVGQRGVGFVRGRRSAARNELCGRCGPRRLALTGLTTLSAACPGGDSGSSRRTWQPTLRAIPVHRHAGAGSDCHRRRCGLQVGVIMDPPSTPPPSRSPVIQRTTPRLRRHHPAGQFFSTNTRGANQAEMIAGGTVRRSARLTPTRQLCRLRPSYLRPPEPSGRSTVPADLAVLHQRPDTSARHRFPPALHSTGQVTSKRSFIARRSGARDRAHQRERQGSPLHQPS